MNITATIIGQILTFAVLVWFVRQLLWDPMTQMLEERKNKIAEGLAEAEKGRHAKALAEQKAVETLKEAKENASEIVGQAQKRAAEIIEEAKDDAKSEGARLITAAQAEIDQQAHQVREALREQVASITLAASSKILAKEIDANAHQEILANVAKEI
ncbi:MAG: F0F1 ATP synthase subunit B [Methylococcales bacterium]|nr:F0F1 ATP synthase subunit B [Methylococcales bacterium]